jgi:hypothetical protein
MSRTPRYILVDINKREIVLDRRKRPILSVPENFFTTVH